MGNEKQPFPGLALMHAGLSRRQLLRIFGVSAAAVTATGLLAACEADDDVDEPDAIDDDPVVDEPDDDEPDVIDPDDDRPVLTIGAHAMPSTLLPNENVSLPGFLTQFSIFEHLILRDWLDSDPPGFGNTLAPLLAESWEFVDDTTLEFVLREDVTWHNGDPFSAEDVIFTFDTIFDEDNAELATARGDYTTISDYEMVDDYTVRLYTEDPDPLLQMRLSTRAGWMLPRNYLEEVGMDEFRMNPVGTGPYRVVSFTPDDEIVCEAHDDYYMHTPAASGVHYRLIPEVSSRVAALVSGEVDIISNIPPDQLETIESADGVHVRSLESLNAHMIRFNTHHPHVADSRIRRALCHAIDREILVDALWFGEARIPAGHQFIDYPESLTYDEFELTYDPDLSRELMEEAGYDGEEIIFRVIPAYYTGYEDAAQAIIEMWNEVGFNAELELTPDGFEQEEDNMVHHWSNSSHMADPAGAQWTNWGEGGPAQGYWWDAPEEYNELGRQQARTLDEDERSEIWRRMNEIWMEERPGTLLYNWLDSWGVSDNVDWQPFGINYMDLRNYNLSFNDD